MITQALHRQPIPINGEAHRKMRVRVPISDWSFTSQLNSIFLAAVEFGDASREFPIVFVRAGTDAEGKEQIAPVAVFGLAREENLILDGSRWRTSYVPALLRMYPFAMGRLDEQSYAVCIDGAWNGLSETEGEALFDEQGAPSAFTKYMQQQIEQVETEVQRTRLVGQRLMELELLRDMRFDATLPSGEQLGVDGFLTVDEAKLAALPDAAIVELQRSGVLGLVHAHIISLGNMRRLAEWRLQRAEAAKAKA